MTTDVDSTKAAPPDNGVGGDGEKDVRHCTRCGSAELESHAAFGGHWQKVCTVCGHVVKTGTGGQ